MDVSTNFMLLKAMVVPMAMELSICRKNVTLLGAWRILILIHLLTKVFSTTCKLMTGLVERANRNTRDFAARGDEI